MVSSDGSRDDEDREEDTVDDEAYSTGPRRSTYTPPVTPPSSVPGMGASPQPDLDETIEITPITAPAPESGPVNVIYQLDDVAPEVPFGVPIEPLEAPPVGSRIAPASEPDVEPSAATPADGGPVGAPTAPHLAGYAPPSRADFEVPTDLPPPVFGGGTPPPPPSWDDVESQPEPIPAAPAQEPAPDLFVEPVFPPVAEPTAEPTAELTVEPTAEPIPDSVPAPTFEPIRDESPQPPDEVPFVTPPPPPAAEPMVLDEAAQLAQLANQGAPAGRPWIPERRSLRDDELAAMMANAGDQPGGTLGMMEELERQLQLRDEESREFKEWQDSMLAVGTPEAIAAVQKVRPEFEDLVPPPASPPLTSAPPPLASASPPVVSAPPPISQAPPPTVPTPPVPSSVPESPPPLIEPPALAEPSRPEPWAIAEGNVVADAYHDEQDQGLTVGLAAAAGIAAVSATPPVDFDSEALIDPAFAGPPTGSVSVLTGSLAIPPEQLDSDAVVDDDDAVDATDQVGFDLMLGVAANPETSPVYSPRIPEDEVVLGDQELERPHAFVIEGVDLEPTPEEQRIGRASRMFWLWFAANASVVSVAFGGILFSLGLSLRQAVVGVLAGVAISILPLGLGALAGKRSSQPTMVVSRAAFGTAGNVVPAVLAVVSRVFWGGVLLWILGQATASILVGAELNGPLSHDLLVAIGMGGGFLVAVVIAVFGYGFVARLQLIVSILSGILIVGIIVLTWSYVDIPAALTHPDGSWLLSGTVGVLVFSFLGLVWANSSADLARYQRPGSSASGAMLWSTFGAILPAFVLIAYGVLLSASNDLIADGLVADPFNTIGLLLPVWYPVPLLAAVALGLISAVVVTVYSGGFALKTVGIGLPRVASVGLIGALVAGLAFAITLFGADLTGLFRDLATTLAVPVAAWAGIFAADAMIRSRPYDTDSLLKGGGIYPRVNFVNLPALVVVTAIGLGLTTATQSWLGWQGYLFTAMGVPLDSELAGTDLGVIVALLLGLLVPIISGIPTIRAQESTSRRSN